LTPFTRKSEKGLTDCYKEKRKKGNKKKGRRKGENRETKDLENRSEGSRHLGRYGKKMRVK